MFYPIQAHTRQLFERLSDKPGRLCKSIMNRPASLRETILDQRSGNAGSPCPLRNRHGFAFEFHGMIIPFVVALFFAGRPSAIFRFIIPVVVLSLNRVFFGRRGTHINKEILEFVPAVTDANASPSVGVPRRMTSRPTTGNHASPDTINAGVFHPMRFIRSREFPSPAAATGLPYGFQVSAAHHTRLPAIALATPMYLFLTPDKPFGNQPPKPVSGKVDKIRHGGIIPQHGRIVNTGVYNTVV